MRNYKKEAETNRRYVDELVEANRSLWSSLLEMADPEYRNALIESSSWHVVVGDRYDVTQSKVRAQAAERIAKKARQNKELERLKKMKITEGFEYLLKRVQDDE